MVVTSKLQWQLQVVVVVVIYYGMVQPLDNMGSIGAVVAAIANVSAPMVSVLEGMAAKINIFTLDNRFTKQENQQLVVAAIMLVLVGAVMGVIGVRSCTVAVQKTGFLVLLSLISGMLISYLPVPWFVPEQC